MRGGGRWTKGQLQKRASSQSSSTYITHPSKVTQGPSKQEFPGARPLLEAREAELGDKLFQSTAPGSSESSTRRQSPTESTPRTTEPGGNSPTASSLSYGKGYPPRDRPKLPGSAPPPPLALRLPPGVHPRTRSCPKLPACPISPAPASSCPSPAAGPPNPPGLTPGLFPGPAQPSLTPTPAPFRSQLGSVSPASPGPQPWRQAGGPPAPLTEAEEGEGAG